MINKINYGEIMGLAPSLSDLSVQKEKQLSQTIRKTSHNQTNQTNQNNQIAQPVQESQTSTIQQSSTSHNHQTQEEVIMSQEVFPVQNVQTDLSLGFSKIGIIGAGGAGKVAAIRASKQLSPSVIRVTTIDTSGVDTAIENINSIKIGNLNGSGKLRSENVETISNFINDWVTKNTFEDITIIIHSLAGGSGSIITPLLINEIARQKKIAIMIGIVDTESEIDTTNVFNSLRSYENITSNHEYYLPTILFNNAFGRTVVDKGIDETVKNIVSILTTPFIGLDTQDRIKFLNPNVFSDITYGIKLLSITTNVDKDWNDSIGMVIPQTTYTKIDSVLLITQKDNHRPIESLCSVSFRGYYESNGQDYLVSIGYHIPQDFVKSLNDRIHSFKSVSDVKKTTFDSEYDIGQNHKKGLVL